MASEIWKYGLALTAEPIEISMPADAELLQVQDQGGTITIWAVVEPKAARVMRRFRIVGTGHAFDVEPLEYLGTVQQGAYVWHVFEVFTNGR